MKRLIQVNPLAILGIVGLAVSACHPPLPPPSATTTATAPIVADSAEASRSGRPLADMWSSTHVGAPAAPERETNNTKTGISEIALERTVCYGTCPDYSVTLTAEGKVTYHGWTYVDRLGAHTGRLDPESFAELARLTLDMGFFDMEGDYSVGWTDHPTVYLSVVRNGTRKTIRHYAPSMSGPPRLAALEHFVDLHVKSVKWDVR